MALPDSDYNDALLNATGQRNWLFLGLVFRARGPGSGSKKRAARLQSEAD
jgi:hypothetical protein